MAQALVNHSLDHLASGVSQQYQEGRHESQVTEMLNCLPSLTRGVLRRNPIYNHDALATGTITNAFTYAYDRGTGTEQYVLIIPGDALGTWYVYNVNDVTKTWTGTNAYFTIPVGDKAKDVFEAMTVGDQTFIVNNTVTVTADAVTNTLPAFKLNNYAFYWIKLTTQVTVAQETISGVSGSLLEGYTYTLNGNSVLATKDTRPSTAVDPNLLSADNIAAQLATFSASYTNDAASSFVYSTTEAVNWNWADTNGSTASLGVWTTVNSGNELPASLPASLDGFIVKVTGGSIINEDDYYLQYSNANKTWVEVAEPGISRGFTPSTMPHVLYALGTPSTRNFVVDTFQTVNAAGTALTGVSAWADRTVGDLLTNKDPSFVGGAITNLFFYQNRLGFISRDSVILSATGDYGRFYTDTIQTVLADDPIDLQVATTDVVTLRHAVPTQDSLILFGDDAQFSLNSRDQAFTPSTANITVLSNYNYSPLMDARALGDKIYFGSVSGGFAQLFAMDASLGTTFSKVTAEPLTTHIPSYLNQNIDKLIGHDVLGQMFMHSEEIPNILYVVSSTSKDGENVQQAFHTWEFENNITGIHIINNELYLIFEAGSIATISLEVPGDITTILYEDINADASVSQYISGLIFSEFYYRDNRSKGTARGRFQLRSMKYTLGDVSSYQTVIRSTTPTLNSIQTAAFGPIWTDTYLWEDDSVWVDAIPDYDRIYYNDDKITVMSSSKNVVITFTNNPYEPNYGFELATVNVEALFYQRSQRT